MAAQNCTAAFVLDRVERVYGRMTRKVKEALLSDINMWINSTCRRWGFDFLTIDPGLSLPNQFPITTLSNVALVFDRWADAGWLITRSGQYSYFIAVPDFTLLAVTNTTSQPVPSPRRKHYVEATRVHRVEQFDKSGNFKKNVHFLPYRQFTRQAKWQTNGTPEFVSMVTQEGISSLVFAPKPNDTYLYRVSFDIAAPPPLDRPDATNVFLQRHPDVVICAGLVQAAKYFGETDKRTEYILELYGPEWAQRANGNFTPGGLLGGIISEDRKRSHDGDMTIEMYTSAKEAIGRGGSSFRRASGSYYVTD